MDEGFDANIARFTGFADAYDRVRPSPPDLLAALLIRLAGGERPSVVVDLGCGTGLSTRYWQEEATRVIGVEPAESMLLQAIAETRAGNVEFIQGLSHSTGIPNASVDIITCSQSLHWMDPQKTFEEVRRIARPGGVFAAFDYDWPPVTGFWEVDAAYDVAMAQARGLESGMGLDRPLKQWDKGGHLQRMAASGCFRSVREICLHQQDRGDARRLVGLLLSQGYVQTLLKAGKTEDEIGVTELREAAGSCQGLSSTPWLWSCRVRLGIV